MAVEVFEGNSADPTTLTPQIAKLKERFGLERVVLVGDRGMLTSARIREEVKPAGLDWISCLRNSAVQSLAANDGPLQMSLFDERDLAEISAPELYPGERLIVCRNPLLAAERDESARRCWRPRKRIWSGSPPASGAAATPCAGPARSVWRSGAVVGKHKMAQAFRASDRRG